MKKIVLTLVFMASLLWAASSGHYSWDQSSAEYVFIIIPAGYTPTIDSVEIENGDEIAVFTPAGECAGALLWAGSATNVAINAWEDNTSTSDSIEGFKNGDQITFRIWDSSENKEYVATAVYSVGDGTYNGNDLYYEVSSIYVHIPDTTLFDTSWHIIALDTAESVVQYITAEKDTVISSWSIEHKVDSSFTQTDSLSDGIVFFSDTAVSVSEIYTTIDSSFDTSYYKPDTTVFDTIIYYAEKSDTVKSIDTVYSVDLDTILTTITTISNFDTTIIQIDSLSDAVVFSTEYDTVYNDTLISDTTSDTLYYDDPVAIEKEDIEAAERKISAFAVFPSVIDPVNTEKVTFYVSKEIGLSTETFEIAIFDMVGNVLASIDETRFIVNSDNDYLELTSMSIGTLRDDARIAGQFLVVVKLRNVNGSVARFKQFIGIKNN